MKILQICLSSSLGGLELYFLENTLVLHNHPDFDVTAVVTIDTALHKRIIEHKIKHITLAKQTGKFPVFSAWNLKKKLNKSHFDLVHVHCKKDLPLAAWLKTFETSLKLVHSRHMNMPGKKKSLYHNFIYGKIDKLLTVTQKLYNDVSENVKIEKDKLEMLYLGVKTPDSISPEDFNTWTKLFEHEEVAFRLAVFGNLNHTKAQHDVIVALNTIQNQLDKPWRLYLIGKFIDTSYEELIRTTIQNSGLESKVIVTGFIENAKKLMSGFDLVVLTTHGETFGLVLVEAMKSGVAVIGTDSEGVPEIIDHQKTGLLFQPGNCQELGESILKLYKNPELRKNLADSGRIKAGNSFDFDKHYQRLFEIYKACF